jgi:hypothetical protein
MIFLKLSEIKMITTFIERDEEPEEPILGPGINPMMYIYIYIYT